MYTLTAVLRNGQTITERFRSVDAANNRRLRISHRCTSIQVEEDGIVVPPAILTRNAQIENVRKEGNLDDLEKRVIAVLGEIRKSTKQKDTQISNLVARVKDLEKYSVNNENYINCLESVIEMLLKTEIPPKKISMIGTPTEGSEEPYREKPFVSKRFKSLELD